jgi:hypothetical protein
MSLILDPSYFTSYKKISPASPFEVTMKYQRCIKCDKVKDLCEFPLATSNKLSSARKNTCRKCSGYRVTDRVGNRGAAEWECSFCNGPYNHVKRLNCGNCGMPRED